MSGSANGEVNDRRSAIFRPGFAAGVVGGLVMAAWMVAGAAIEGMEPLAALRPIGNTFGLAEPGGEGAGALLYGLALHTVFAGAVGAMLTALLPRELEPRFASIMTVGFALGVMAVMTQYVLPAYSPRMREQMPDLGGYWVVAHAAYGATVGLLAQALRQRGRVPGRTRPAERSLERA